MVCGSILVLFRSVLFIPIAVWVQHE
jgi:hypothetical protein